jgi:hypothetical protein
MCMLTVYGLQSVMLSDSTWPFDAFLERRWRVLHKNIRMDFTVTVGVDWITLALNCDQ